MREARLPCFGSVKIGPGRIPVEEYYGNHSQVLSSPFPVVISRFLFIELPELNRVDFNTIINPERHLHFKF